MSSDGQPLIETVTLSQARSLIECAAHRQSFLLLSPPGVGKSDMVAQAAAGAGLACRSLLGTQMAPEDVTGVPYIIGERSVFCPPRVLLPESPEPFCLFLDELPACAPDIQKAFYSLLLERRLGEHYLPPDTWVVAAGNRSEDRALVRTISSALVNRVIVLQIRVDCEEWFRWAAGAGVRNEVVSFIRQRPEFLLSPIPKEPIPFSTPRAWASLSRALALAEEAGALDEESLRGLVYGRVLAEHAKPFCVWWNVCRGRRDNFSQLSLHEVLELSIRELGLSNRAMAGLDSAGICSVRNLAGADPKRLCALPEFDAARVQEVEEALASLGMRLGMELEGVD